MKNMIYFLLVPVLASLGGQPETSKDKQSDEIVVEKEDQSYLFDLGE